MSLLKNTLKFRFIIYLSLAVVITGICQAPALATQRVLLLNNQNTERVVVENDPRLNPVSGITIEAWVRPEGVSGCETIVGKGYQTAYWLGLCNGKVRYYVNGGLSSADGNATLPAGEWSHIAVTFDGVERRYYINGELDYSANRAGTSGINAEALGIGGEGSSSSYPDGLYPFTGRISEVRLWDHARTLTQIRTLMYQQVAEEFSGLIGVWPLDNWAEDRFGRFSSVLAPGASFSVPSSPPIPHNPLVIPNVLGITLNGSCADAAYSSAARLPAWYLAADRQAGKRNPDDIYLAATGVYLWVCLPYRKDMADPLFSVELDPNNDGGSLLDTDDYRFAFWPEGTGMTTARGQQQQFGNVTFSSWSNPVTNPAGFWAGQDIPEEFSKDFEMRIPRSIFPSLGGTFRIRVNHDFDVGSGVIRTATWPPGSDVYAPNTWQEFKFDYSQQSAPDSIPPNLVHLTLDDYRPREGQVNRLSVDVYDNVDVELVEFLIDGELVHSQSFEGVDDTRVTAEYLAEFDYAPGRHTFTARAYDQQGLLGQGRYRSFQVEVDGEAPRVSMLINPRNPVAGQKVTLTAIALDPAGIRHISIKSLLGGHLPTLKNCDLPSAGTSAVCSWEITPPPGLTMIRVVASASDAEGHSDSTGDYVVLWGNSGLDTDQDGLSDFTESGMCTRWDAPDSDFDGLSDGWELLGVSFSDLSSLNLPDFETNPCWKDILLQLDYESGAAPMGVNSLINQFRERSTRVYVELSRRPTPTAYDQSHIGAYEAVYQKDNGEFYFDPKRQWAFYYGYYRNQIGSSGAGGRFFSIDARSGPSGYCSAGVKAGNECKGDWECPGAVCQAGCTGGTNAGGACSARTDCPIDDGSFASCQAPCVTKIGATGRVCASTPDLPYRLFHELGHTIGFGHGGINGTLITSNDRGRITTDHEWNNQNFKPHQVSVMNYMYNQGKLCLNPLPSPLPENYSPDFVGEITLLDESVGDLDENNLSEAANNPTTLSLQNTDCSHADPGAVPVIRYTCKFDDQQMQVLTDGARTVARAPKGGAWTFDVPAHDAGIDWNCNGVIDPQPVSENIDASGRLARGFSWDENLWRLDSNLAGRTEFPAAPKPSACQILYRIDCENRVNSCYIWPKEYRDQIKSLLSGPDPVDCRDEFLATRDEHEKMACREGEDAEFSSTKTCPLASLGSPTVAFQSSPLIEALTNTAFSAGPLGDVQDESDEGESLWPVPRVEQCDGEDNDGDGEIDENCRDTDSDGVPDAIDNCHTVANTSQIDRDRDGLGDDCQFPALTSVSANWNGSNKVHLSWGYDGVPHKGVAIYRYGENHPQPSFRGQSYPTAEGTSFTDSVNVADNYTYVVRVINADGREGEPLTVEVGVSVSAEVFEDSFESP